MVGAEEVQGCSSTLLFQSLGYLGNQEAASVAPHYIAQYEIPTKKSETAMKMLHTCKIQIFHFCCIRKKAKCHTLG